MRAVQVRRFGGPEVLQVVEVPAPDRPGPGELLVEVEAAGLGSWDLGTIAGRMGNFGFPFTPGAELAGQVLRVGPGVTGFAPGHAVWAYPGLVGCWQEVALVPAATASRRPAAVTGIDAGGMPVCAVTAYQGLVDLLDLKPSETLLVTGGGGALGSQVVQLGGWIGARVIATASAEDHDWMGELGASDALDYGGPWLQRLRDLAYDGVDAVFDTVGGDVMVEASYGVRDGGRIVTSVTRRDDPRLDRGVTWRFFGSQGTTARLTTLAGLVDAASLVPTTGLVFPLEDVRDAVAAQLAPHRGKVVLTLG